MHLNLRLVFSLGVCGGQARVQDAAVKDYWKVEGLVGVALIGFVPVFFVGRAAYYCTHGRCRDGNEIRWRDFQLSGTVCMYNDSG